MAIDSHDGNSVLNAADSSSAASLSLTGDRLERQILAYADLIVRKGCAIVPGQELLVSCDIECRDFARAITRAAYEAGCKRVYVKWSDEGISRMTYDHCPVEEFETFPAWSALQNNSLAESGAAVLTIESPDPDAMKGVDPRKIQASVMASHTACAPFYDSLDFGRTKWCIAGAPSRAWAAKVFPGVDGDVAIEMLWNAILDAARATGDDPISDWERHDAGFEERKVWLNSLRLDSLLYRSSNCTELVVGLPKGHIWHGGAGVTVDGTRFFPNIPTEEIYTSPDRARTEGVVHSALPLVYQGNLIEDFWIRFESGEAVSCGAAKGQDVLASIISADKGSCRLGEAALVPYSSPIRQSGTLFYSTLFDENASCHLALGKSFPECVEGGLGMGKEELLELGLNDSAVHVDFMVGSDDLSITGIDGNGSEIAIFESGEWARG